MFSVASVMFLKVLQDNPQITGICFFRFNQPIQNAERAYNYPQLYHETNCSRGASDIKYFCRQNSCSGTREQRILLFRRPSRLLTMMSRHFPGTL